MRWWHGQDSANRNKWRILGFTAGTLLARLHLVRTGWASWPSPEPKVVDSTPASRTI